MRLGLGFLIHLFVFFCLCQNEKCPRIEPKRAINLGGEGFQVDKLLGQGGFARVYKVKSLENNRTYAIKVSLIDRFDFYDSVVMLVIA